MKQKELIEMVQQHHTDTGETIIRKALNRAMDEFASKTKIIDAVSALDANDVTVVGQRFYALPPDLLELKRVELDNISIPRTISRPIEGDIT
tara:strand:- start:727 stop:1002 length:276 start_codon:yes stop_codon:yes gene_type:complete